MFIQIFALLANPFYTKGSREIYTIFDEFDEVRNEVDTAFDNTFLFTNSNLSLKEDKSNKDIADGYAGLDSYGFLKIAELPDGFGNAYYVKEDQSNMNAISLPVEGNMCLVLDDGDGKRASYVYRAAPTNAWQKLSDEDFINLNLDAANITTGTLLLDRIPSTLTGKDADTLDGKELSTIESEYSAEVDLLKNSKIFRIDINGKTSAQGADGQKIAFSNISEAMDAIEADIVLRIAASETRSDCKYIVKINPGVYTESFSVPACSFIQFDMPGAILSGNINRQATQTGFGGDYYSKVIFNGGDAIRPEKGHQSLISGDITLSTEGASYLQYITFRGLELSGNIEALNSVVVMGLDHTSHYTSGKTITGTGTILLEMLNRSRIKATLTGDVACYNCMNSELNSVNITPTNDSSFINMDFGGSIIIAASNISLDGVSHKSLMSQTPTLTGATILYHEDAGNIGNDSNISGTTIKDALNYIASIPSTNIYVDCDRVDTYTEVGSIEFPYKTISDAYTAASDSAVIVVNDSSCTETLIISKPITIKSKTGNYRTSNASIVGSISIGSIAGTLSDVSLIGLNLSGTENTVSILHGYNTTNVTILNNKIVSSNNDPFLMSSTPGVHTNLVVEGNYIDANGAGVSDSCVWFTGVVNGTFKNNKVVNCPYNGIVAESLTGVIFEDNYFDGAGQSNMQIANSASSEAIIRNNYFTGYNTSLSSDKGAIAIYPNSDGITIENNIITNGFGGIVIRDKAGSVASDVIAHYNKIYNINSNSYGISNYAQDGGILDAKWNWLGDSTGGDDDAGIINGIGVKISNNVNIEPFITYGNRATDVRNDSNIAGTTVKDALDNVNTSLTNLSSSYGEMYHSNTNGTEFEFTDLNTFYKYNVLTEGNNQLIVASSANSNFTVPVGGAGIYGIRSSISFSGDNSVIVSGSLFKNNVEVEKIGFVRKLGLSGDVGSTGFCGELELVEGDYLDLRFSSNEASKSIYIYKLNFGLVRH